jgi:hypothetical protein
MPEDYAGPAALSIAANYEDWPLRAAAVESQRRGDAENIRWGVIGGSGLGLVLLIALIVYLMGGFRTRS